MREASGVDDAPAAHSGLDEALDTAVQFLRSFGQHAFEIGGVDITTFARQCDAWAKHLAIGAPHPDADPNDPAAARQPRDWVGARHFFARRREQETTAITTSLGNLREVIADLTERLATNLVEDQAGDSRLAEHVERLRAASSLESVQALQQEVSTVAGLLTCLLEDRNRVVRAQLVELDTRIAALSEELQEVRRESSLDGLTRVFNRGAFDRAFGRMFRLASVSADAACLVLVDLDHLKTINDRYGHRAGDEALRIFADHLVRSFPRRSDFVARYGGDELVAILPRTSAADSTRLATRFLESIRQVTVNSDSQPFRITSSMGLAELKRGESQAVWLDRADRALYEAKAAGRDRLVIAP
ncbi:MAG: diguanylate cyclase [Chloroflexi bacterium]|nr:diguanylate cyclase [Chloroflexota bacterium]